MAALNEDDLPVDDVTELCLSEGRTVADQDESKKVFFSATMRSRSQMSVGNRHDQEAKPDSGEISFSDFLESYIATNTTPASAPSTNEA